MNERSKRGLFILRTAAFCGIFGNILLRQTPWGLNAFLFVTFFTAALFLLTKRWNAELLSPSRLSLMGAMVFFGAMFVIRDSIELRVFDTFAILTVMGVLLLAPLRVNERLAGIFHYACGFVWSAVVSTLAPIVILGFDIDWKAAPGTRVSHRIFSVIRAFAVALPLMLIFGALFSSADARFAGFVSRLISFDMDTVISNVVITSVLAWLTAGYFRGAIVTPNFAVKLDADLSDAATNAGTKNIAADDDDVRTLPDNATILEHVNRSDPPNSDGSAGAFAARRFDWESFDSSRLPAVFTVGKVELTIILGLIDVLFSIFVFMQLPYLFGGIELIQNTPDLKLADYARRGFGELVVAAALVLPMLLLSHWLLRRSAKGVEGLFRTLAGVQIALVFVVMASAFQRLVLLTGEAGYGMTTARFYPMVFMLWLAVVFGWFAVTVLRGLRSHFAWGTLWAAVVILAATNLINPDAFIARTNLALMQQGRSYDAGYNARLSADAVPVVVSALPEMNSENQCRAKWALHDIYRDLSVEGDFRSLNLSRKSAFYLLRENDAALHQLEGCPAWMSISE